MSTKSTNHQLHHLIILLMIVPTILAAITDKTTLIDNLRKQIQMKEDELQRTEMINRNFERMIQLVNILGQIDTFLTERTKVAIKKLATLVDENDSNNNSNNLSD